MQIGVGSFEVQPSKLKIASTLAEGPQKGVHGVFGIFFV